MKIADIRTDGGTQARASLNQDTVNEYANQMQDGAIFPPVVVFNDGSDNWLADGFHRYFAHRQNGALEIEVELHSGTVDDATLYAFGATARRGLSFTKEDLQEIVSRMMKHSVWSTWSTRKIAEHIGCSAMTISRVKSSLEEPSNTVSYTRNGKSKTMNTSSIGKSTRARKKSKKKEPTEKSENDVPVEFLDEINKLSEENDRLKDAIAIGQFDASEIEKIDIEETISDLREQIRVKDIEIQALKESRDMFQNENAELKRTVKSLQAKLKKVEE
jgi:DNA-binding transcriptional regulator YhcF (GntR family)